VLRLSRDVPRAAIVALPPSVVALTGGIGGAERSSRGRMDFSVGVGFHLHSRGRGAPKHPYSSCCRCYRTRELAAIVAWPPSVVALTGGIGNPERHSRSLMDFSSRTGSPQPGRGSKNSGSSRISYSPHGPDGISSNNNGRRAYYKGLGRHMMRTVFRALAGQKDCRI